MEAKRGLIVAGIIIILILGILAGTIYYLTQSFRNNISENAEVPRFSATPSPTSQFLNQTPSPSPTPRPTPIVRVSPRPSQTPSPSPSLTQVKIYTGDGFSLSYQQNWGTVACSNSSNFEFDPVNLSSQRIVCDRAIKPITVIVGNTTNCQGETVQLGKHQVIKLTQTNVSISGNQYLTNYQWCLNIGSKGLIISHRVSNNNAPASSREDLSSQVERIISSIR